MIFFKAMRTGWIIHLLLFVISANAKQPDHKVPTPEIMTTEPKKCPKTESTPTYLPHEGDCSLFYTCQNGIPILSQCPPNLHFNAKMSVCDFPQNAGCKEVTNLEEDGCPLHNGDSPVLLPDPDDCGQFFLCDHGKRYAQVCPPGLHFNTAKKHCDHPEAAGCHTGNDISPKEDSLCPPKNGLLPALKPHEEECELFYICDHGVAHLKKCPDGLHFNSKVGACDRKENAKCTKVGSAHEK